MEKRKRKKDAPLLWKRKSGKRNSGEISITIAQLTHFTL